MRIAPQHSVAENPGINIDRQVDVIARSKVVDTPIDNTVNSPSALIETVSNGIVHRKCAGKANKEHSRVAAIANPKFRNLNLFIVETPRDFLFFIRPSIFHPHIIGVLEVAA